MSETKEKGGKNYNEKGDHAAVISPASPVESSPLSSPPCEPELEAVEVHRDETADGASKPVSIYVTPAEEDSTKDEPTPSFKCPDCDKTYSNEKSLKRHINDKKSVCFRNRGENDNSARWSCPRCHAQLSKESSTARHIKDSCWKTCDECIEINRTDCDANNLNNNCTNCEEAGKSCTKHTEPVADCVPELLTAASAEPDDAPRETKPAGKIRRAKRKAAKSPDASPKAKPKLKSRRVKNTGSIYEKELEAQFEEDEAVQSDHDSYAVDLNTKPSPSCIPAPPPVYRRHESYDMLQIPRPDRTSMPSEQQIFQTMAAANRSSHMLPPPPGYASFSNSSAVPYARDTQEMLQRQVQAIQGMSQYTLGYGAGVRPTCPAPVMSSTRSSLDLGSRGERIGNIQSYRNRSSNPLGGARQDMTSLNVPPPVGYRPRRNMTPLEVPPPIHLPYRRSIIDGQSGLRASSRQPSRQSSAEDLRSSRNSDTSGQIGTDNNHNRDINVDDNNENENESLVIKLPLSRELKQKLSTTLLPPPSFPQNHVIRLRIHSNTFDPTGLPIFSILTLRLHDLFGPRLQYYCHVRGKQFGVDWKFVYSYLAPTSQQRGRMKYFDLTWNMKPAGCRDNDYPGAAMRDGDTIYVVGRRPGSHPNNAGQDGDNWVEDSIQLSPDIIAIQPGETVYQSPTVNATWYHGAEKALNISRQQLGHMQNALQQAQMRVEACENMIAELKARNAILVQGHAGGREAGHMPSQQQGPMADSYHLQNFGHAASSGSMQIQQGPVRDAADKVATGEERNEQEMEM